MEKPEFLNRVMYNKENTALLTLSSQELSGTYPTWFYNYDVNQYNSHWAYPKSLEQIQSFVESLASDSSKIVFAIYDTEQALHIGNISIQSIDLLNRTAELAFLLGEKQAWGKGHGTRSAQLCLNHCFQHLGLNRVYLGCLKSNIAMNKLATKLGFCQEGVRRQAVLHSGQYVDVIEYGLLKLEYEKNTASGA